MSCSGEIVAENDLLQIKPAVTKKLKLMLVLMSSQNIGIACHYWS